jgi:predicted GNAT superfamily acetyltransferase
MLASPQPAINVRPLREHSELDAAVALQRDIWRYEDRDLDSRALLTVAARFAGQVIGAFDGERLVGFTLAFATFPIGRLHSHRLGVHPDYQSAGVGRKLKLAQRADALSHGITVMQWTFDPLQSRNAYFNLVRLGGIATAYLSNLYGITSSPLHGTLPTDRLLIEWQLESERVQSILEGGTPRVSKDARQVCLPPDAERHDPAHQARMREEFLDYLGRGYVVTGFRQDSEPELYVLEKM